MDYNSKKMCHAINCIQNLLKPIHEIASICTFRAQHLILGILGTITHFYLLFAPRNGLQAHKRVLHFNGIVAGQPDTFDPGLIISVCPPSIQAKMRKTEEAVLSTENQLTENQ